MLLLDTNVLIRIHDVQLPDDRIALSALSYAELQFGIARTTDAELQRRRRTELVRLTAMFPLGWLAFEVAAAESYGRLAGQVAQHRPAHARSTDIMLAGHALSLGATLVTFNTKDFALVADLIDVVAPTLR